MHGEVVLMIDTVSLPNGYAISDARARLDIAPVHDLLADTYWAVGRTREQTQRSWANCLCFGIAAPDGTQVGTGRMLADYIIHFARILPTSS